MNTRVSEIQVSRVDPNIARMFASIGAGRIAPKGGVVLYRMEGGRFEAVAFLESGGKRSTILEIVDGMLRPVPN